jgi:hypothetical protein
MPSCGSRPGSSRRIIFTEDRKDHEDNPFDVKGQRLELHETTQQTLGPSHKFSRARSENFATNSEFSFTGNLTAELEVNHSPKGRAVVSASIANNAFYGCVEFGVRRPGTETAKRRRKCFQQEKKTDALTWISHN